MQYLHQVQKGIDFIEARLDEEIDLGAVAKHSGISQWHFQRIFKALTNETLKTYIRSRRMANALEGLSRSDRRVIDIALAAGFETQESFTRAFKKAFGVTPAQCRRRGARFQFLHKARFDEAYLRHLNRGLSLEPEIYEQPAMALVGMQTRYYGADSEKNNLARKLPPLWARFLERLDGVPRRVGRYCYGVVRQTPTMTDELDYFAVTEVDEVDRAPRGMVTIALPGARYAKFTHIGPVGSLDQTVNYIYSSWLLRSGMRHTYGADLEFYGPEYDPQSDRSVVHYAIPITPAE